MRKVLLILSLLLLLVPIVNAQAPKFGVGVFGGISIPVLQADQERGTTFGLKARLKVLPFLVAEPNLTFGKWGKPDAVEGFELGIDGSKIKSYGVDVTIGSMPGIVGFKPYTVVGVGYYTIKNDDTGYDESNFGLNAGFGMSIGFSAMLDIDVCGRLIIVPQDDGSKKAIAITGGINYYFGS